MTDKICQQRSFFETIMNFSSARTLATQCNIPLKLYHDMYQQSIFFETIMTFLSASKLPKERVNTFLSPIRLVQFPSFKWWWHCPTNCMPHFPYQRSEIDNFTLAVYWLLQISFLVGAEKIYTSYFDNLLAVSNIFWSNQFNCKMKCR